MKKLFIPEDTLSNKISYYHIVLFLVFLPFDRFYSELVLMSFALHTIIHLRKMKWKQVFNKDLLVLLAVFIVSVLATGYTVNKAQGYSLISRQLAIVIFPLVLLANPLPLLKYRDNFFSIFSLTCILLVLYLYLDACRVMTFYHLPFTAIISNSFINHNFSLPIALHATYLSMYLSLALVFLITVYYRSTTAGNKALIVAGIFILLAGLLQLGSRSVLLATLVITMMLVPVFFLQQKQRSSYLLITGVAFCIGCIAILSGDSLRNRYVNELEKDLGKATENAPTTPRMERWKLAFELVKASPVIGHGSGDETDLLMEKYFEHQFYNAYLFKLNSHNQYLGFLIKSGIIGLLVYLSVLYYGLRSALKRRDILFLSFLVIIAIVSFSENYLDVNKGIFFYAFFFSFFLVAERKCQPAAEYSRLAGNHDEPYPVLTY